MKKLYLILGLVFGLQTLATAQLTCGDTFLDSGGAAGDYQNGENDTITICPTLVTDVVSLNFSAFDLEDTYDFMYIYDGNSVAGDLIGTYSGTNSPGVISAENLSGCLTVVFTSDISVPSSGWEAAVTCIPEPTCFRPSDFLVSVTESSATFSWTANSGETSWGVEYGAPGFTPGTGTFMNTSSNPLVLNGLPNMTSYEVNIYALCSAIDTSSVLGPISFTTNALPLTCGDMYYDTGNDTANYQFDEVYTRVICPTVVGEIVVLTFSEFNTEQGYDSLVIFNGNSTSDPVLGVYQGTTNPGTIFSTNVNGCLTAKFTSDNVFNTSGWAATITCQAPITCLTPTNFVVDSQTDLTATISWTNGASETQWIVEYGAVGFLPGTGTSVNTSTNPFTISGLNELTDYDVYIRASCGGTDTSFYSSVISFTTDISPLPPFICGNNFTDAGGVNGDYSNNAQDTIVICPSNPGDMVSLIFSEYNTENNFDTLFIYDGNSTAGALLIALDSIQTPGTITATNVTGCLTTVFTSDGSAVRSGWVALIDCPLPVVTCLTPTTPITSNVATTSASLGWTNGGSELGWIVEYGVSGFTPGTGTMLPATTNPFSVSGLTANTAYQFYVTAVCSLTDTSSMSSVGTFTTLPNSSGISENEINTLSIAPNPSTGKFVIKNTSSIQIEAQLFDAQGRAMNLDVNSIDGNKEIVLDLNNFVNGVYFLKTSSNNGIKTYSLVKN